MTPVVPQQRITHSFCLCKVTGCTDGYNNFFRHYYNFSAKIILLRYRSFLFGKTQCQKENHEFRTGFKSGGILVLKNFIFPNNGTAGIKCSLKYTILI